MFERVILHATEGEQPARQVYWGDRLTVPFWLLCFGLMLAWHVVEAIHRLVLVLLGSSPAP